MEEKQALKGNKAPDDPAGIKRTIGLDTGKS